MERMGWFGSTFPCNVQHGMMPEQQKEYKAPELRARAVFWVILGGEGANVGVLFTFACTCMGLLVVLVATF